MPGRERQTRKAERMCDASFKAFFDWQKPLVFECSLEEPHNYHCDETMNVEWVINSNDGSVVVTNLSAKRALGNVKLFSDNVVPHRYKQVS
jgi:hypothetical protein